MKMETPTAALVASRQGRPNPTASGAEGSQRNGADSALDDPHFEALPIGTPDDRLRCHLGMESDDCDLVDVLLALDDGAPDHAFGQKAEHSSPGRGQPRRNLRAAFARGVSPKIWARPTR